MKRQRGKVFSLNSVFESRPDTEIQKYLFLNTEVDPGSCSEVDPGSCPYRLAP